VRASWRLYDTSTRLVWCWSFRRPHHADGKERPDQHSTWACGSSLSINDSISTTFHVFISSSASISSAIEISSCGTVLLFRLSIPATRLYDASHFSAFSPCPQIYICSLSANFQVCILSVDEHQYQRARIWCHWRYTVCQSNHETPRGGISTLLRMRCWPRKPPLRRPNDFWILVVIIAVRTFERTASTDCLHEHAHIPTRSLIMRWETHKRSRILYDANSRDVSARAVLPYRYTQVRESATKCIELLGAVSQDSYRLANEELSELPTRR